MNPSDFSNMIPGSILVCPMTSPGWTQLFAHAQGLVTDIGGILGHGSIVAREYGIPSVVGTGNCKVRIKHGQMIEVDGDGGTVRLVEDCRAANRKKRLNIGSFRLRLQADKTRSFSAEGEGNSSEWYCAADHCRTLEAGCPFLTYFVTMTTCASLVARLL